MWKCKAETSWRSPISNIKNQEPAISRAYSNALSKSGAIAFICLVHMCILIKAISHFFHVSRFMVIFQFGNLSTTPGREAL